MRLVLVLAWISPTLPKTLSDVRQPFQMACVKEAANVMHEAELRPYIEACQLGERRAQRFIFERYYRLMFGVCLQSASLPQFMSLLKATLLYLIKRHTICGRNCSPPKGSTPKSILSVAT